MQDFFERPQGIIVIYDGRATKLVDIGLARIFNYLGRAYQTSVRPIKFEYLPEKRNFRFRSQWYQKRPNGGYAALQPNAPFGICKAGPVSGIEKQDSVEELVITERND